MGKLKYIFLAIFLLFFLGVILLAIFGKKTVTMPPIIAPATPTPVALQNPNTTSALKLISTNPANNATNVSLDQQITLLFNKDISDYHIAFAIAPSVTYTAATQGATLTITPTEPLQSDTTYTYFITIDGLPTYTATFSTIHNPNVTTAPDNAADVQNEINKHNYPDQYLYSYTPYTTDDFSITSDYNTATNRFVFTVTYSTDEQTAKNEVSAWIASLGLTPQQIQQLSITYQPATPGF